MNTAKNEFQRSTRAGPSTWPRSPQPAENEYYTKLDLENQSSSTAPDVMYEDTFFVNSDVAAGYLAPLNSYVLQLVGLEGILPGRPAGRPRRRVARSTASPWGPIPAACITTKLLAKAGIPVPWHPTTLGPGAGRGREGQGHRARRDPDQRLWRRGRGRSVVDAGVRNVPLRHQQLAVGQQDGQMGEGRGRVPGRSRGVPADLRQGQPRPECADRP